MRGSTPAPRPGSRPRARRAARSLAGWALLAGIALLAVGCGALDERPVQSALDPAGPVARAQDQLWNIVFPIAVGVFVLVQGAIIFAMIRYRSRGDEATPPNQIEGNTRLEVLWTIIPALILAGIAVPTVRTIFVQAAAPEEALEVRVIGKQYFWEFQYEDPATGDTVHTATELHIPTGMPVLLSMESHGIGGEGAADGVIHSFWVPRLAGKQDVVPGHVRPLIIEADEPGEYHGQCAEFCGLSHANMLFTVVAHEPADFDAWLTAEAEPASAEGLEGLAAEGERAFETAGCIGCHAVRGETSEGEPREFLRIGPDLTHLMSRGTFAGGVFETTPENLAAWIADPPGVKPGAQMPDLGLDEETIDALVAYLTTLK
ncbi:MAG TPA: cytochrome c oxidase subunit II [Egibacteraceae bacterium]|nr:cytochrome c oxidase subunit II [Egibacteraceae bacterium]